MDDLWILGDFTAGRSTDAQRREFRGIYHALPGRKHLIRFARFAKNIVVLRGGMSGKDRKAAHSALNVAYEDERLILATGRYIGEGFDDKRLDTLFLTMPIAWKGTLAQYVGRLHRQHGEKKDVLMVD